MHKRKGRRGRPKVRCSPRSERLQLMVAGLQSTSSVDPALSEKRREAARKRWDRAKATELDMEEDSEHEFAHSEAEDESLDEAGDGSDDSEAAAPDNEEVVVPDTSGWRFWIDLKDLLPADQNFQAALLHTIQKQHKFPFLKLEKKPEVAITVSKTTFYRIKSPISQHLTSLKNHVLSHVILKWAQVLAKEDIHLLNNHGIFFTEEGDIPRESLAQLLCDQILNRMRADLKTKIMKNFNTKVVVDTAEGLVNHIREVFK